MSNKDIVLRVTYYIYLPRSDEYITETNDDKIWCKCSSTDKHNLAYESGNFIHALTIAEFIKKDKNLCQGDIVVKADYIKSEYWSDDYEV